MATVVVSPRTKRPTHDLSLFNPMTGQKVGLLLEGGPRGIREDPATPSTLAIDQKGNEFGDHNPHFAHVEQSDWTGGRGLDRFSDDPTRFGDSLGAWTLTPGRILNGPLMFAPSSGIRSQLLIMQGITESANNLAWQPLLGAAKYFAYKHTVGASSLTADKAYAWIRRVGSPGTLTFEIKADSGGKPTGAALQSVTKTVSTITDFVSALQVFDWSGTQSLTNGTVYHIIFYGASADTPANHWEVGCTSSTSSNSNVSIDGSTWTNGTYPAIWSWVVDADVNRLFIFFELDGQQYAVSKPAAGGAPNLYMNGFRGKATSATSTTLSDTNKSFSTIVQTITQMTVKIINGTGIGQVRRVSSFGSSTQIVVSTAWDITPDTTSEYVVTGSLTWYEVTGHGLTVPVTSVTVTGNLPGVAYFAQGTTTMRRMRFDASIATPAHGFAADVTTDVDLLYTFYDPASKATQVWGAFNGTSVGVMRAPALAWGTNLTFGTLIPCGSTQYKITGLCDYKGVLIVTKENEIGYVENDVYHPLNIGFRSSPSATNGVALAVLNNFLYVNFMHSLERIYGLPDGTVDDIGPWKGSGIPSGRTGPISAMCVAFSWLFYSVDGGASGTSSVFVYDGLSHHEIFRGWEAGQRIQSLYWQAIEGAAPRLWIGIGGNIIFLMFPIDSLNPLNDSGFLYRHEFVVQTGIIDLDKVGLPKFWEKVKAVTKNLSQGTFVSVDYQADDSIGGSTWTPISDLYSSPEDETPIDLPNNRQLVLRFRGITDSVTIPVEMRAWNLEGFAVLPVKYQYTVQLKTSDRQRNLRQKKDIKTDDLIQFLKDAASLATPVFVGARVKRFDGIRVKVEPPTITPEFWDAVRSQEGAKLTLVLREA